ncbi:hypothetical protein V5O48_017337 [Marasmius crinis-equi]|uniref:Uncharacterized protein n=1 Tax=Marasmius crinis-equi TaxID=585013 RepID=A0ABR3EP85_9AGAR
MPISLPEPRSFVVLSLDPVASVEHLHNPELTESCRKLECKKYVALVGMRDQPSFWSDRAYHSYIFDLVYQGLRKADEEKCITPEMSIPILPNMHHPSSRQPLQPSLPLPWADCFASHVFRTSARCRSAVLDEKPSDMHEISDDEAYRFKILMSDDSAAHGKQIRLKSAPSIAPSVDTDEGKSGAWPIESGCNIEAYFDGGSLESEEEEDDEDEFDPEIEEYTRIMAMVDREKLRRENPDGDMLVLAYEEYLRIRTELGLPSPEEKESDTASVCTRELELLETPVFRVSYDLSEVDCVNDPEDYFEELEALRRLKEQHEDAKTQQEIEKARRIDEEYFASRTQGSHQPADAPSNHQHLTLVSRLKRSLQIVRRFFCL